ncbi:MAG: valine--tRNA ligase, partial [Umezawaea sp.]
MTESSTTPQRPELPAAWQPSEVEAELYQGWVDHGYFTADVTSDKPPFTIVLPPPNVTGNLHVGHALNHSIMDALTRRRRMQGYEVLWLPGMDHAGISTQNAVERDLANSGLSRHDLGREKFVERVWEWKEEYGGKILDQMRRLGDGVDWTRERFTMDEGLSKAVQTIFKKMFDDGLIYRAERIINWCPRCQTALSDIEVEHSDDDGELVSIRYGEGANSIVVATTRAETMLGDTAVAVHPEDERYAHLVGTEVEVPLTGRRVPIVADEHVDPKFGTGAVKVTPAHDFNDFATGKRHKLEEINIFNLDGTMNDHGGPFAGLDRKRARTAVKKALDEKGLARGSKPHVLTLPKCQRSGGVVEPMISTQWFTKMKDMADEAVKAVRDGRTKIIPEEWQKTYDHFLENIQDWCISRQLWWGHQIPAWHGPNGEIKVGRTRPPECGEGWEQDPDVLDTWFSSALWPFSTLGWPNQTEALRKFYPASDLE